MNVKLLRKVQKHILEEPRRINMNTVISYVDPSDKESPPCGTVGCIAGWTNILSRNPDGYMYDAAAALDLNPAQKRRLFTEPFYTGKKKFPADTTWPAKFAARYEKAKTAKTRAKVTSERIDHFIKTKGKE